MLMVGLTGGIGAGKSVAARLLARRGAVVIDADRLAREVVAPGTDGLAEVVAAFGPQVLGPDGALDRPALGARVFGDEPARRRLEGIIHPRVRARTAQLAAAAPPDAIVVNDVPLLVEAGLAGTYHLVLVVTASEPTRVARLVADRGMTPAQAHARIRAQASDQRRATAADVLLVNDGPLDELAGQVDQLWRARLVPYERNLRQRRPAPAPDDRSRVAYQPDWPAQYARIAARVTAAVVVAGDPAGPRIEHIGPTAVPDLPAPDLIDVQLAIDPPGGADAVAGPLARAGLVPLPAGPDQPAGEHRYAGADPGRPVRLFVRRAATPPWRDALLLRDWLRADPAARAAYTGHPGAQLWPGAWEQARAWAGATGWQP